jgi:hypothetical protein
MEFTSALFIPATAGHSAAYQETRWGIAYWKLHIVKVFQGTPILPATIPAVK